MLLVTAVMYSQETIMGLSRNYYFAKFLPSLLVSQEPVTTVLEPLPFTKKGFLD